MDGKRTYTDKAVSYGNDLVIATMEEAAGNLDSKPPLSPVVEPRFEPGFDAGFESALKQAYRPDLRDTVLTTPAGSTLRPIQPSMSCQMRFTSNSEGISTAFGSSIVMTGILRWRPL